MIIITLPWPPTTNTYWRHVPIGGAVRSMISKRGRQYRRVVCSAVMAQAAAKRLSGKLSVEIHAFVPDRRARDLDNILKALFDACTYAGVWLDDSQIGRLCVIRRERVSRGYVVMEVETLHAP